MQNEKFPKLFWHSDPVKPDETLMVSGEDFPDGAVAELSDESHGWTALEQIQSSSQCIKALIPAGWTDGIWNFRIRTGESVSALRQINAPDVWWCQGENGINRTTSGSWLRLFGKNLDKAEVRLGKKSLKPLEVSCWHLKYQIPTDVPFGLSVLSINRIPYADIEILSPEKEKEFLLNVVDFGADPSGMKDSTPAIVRTLERMKGIGKCGVIYFPRGRYRIDSNLRSGNYIRTSLKIPTGFTIRGEGQNLVSLWWTDQPEPLPALLEGGDNFTVEDLSIYTQGNHSTIIHGENNVRIRRVTIRANRYYMTMYNGGRHHGTRVIASNVREEGAAVSLMGINNQVLDCDIYCTWSAIALKYSRGCLIAGNRIMGWNFIACSGGDGYIVENNDFSGNQLTTRGNDVNMHFGATCNKHLYFAHNKISHLYGGDHESITTDGHCDIYHGRFFKKTDLVWRLEKNIAEISPLQNGLQYGKTVFITAGYGRGQYRELAAIDGSEVTIASPWDVEPDDTSLMMIGGFNGRHLFIGNVFSDTGAAIQLYPPNYECIVAENRTSRSSNFNSLGCANFDHGREDAVEPSWYNQFLDNHVETGNAWGGGSMEVDGWLGGETFLYLRGYWAFQKKIGDVGLWQHYLFALKEKTAPPIVLYQTVRRHRIDNNSSIKISGSVGEVVVEKCSIEKSDAGIFVCAVSSALPQKEDAGQLCNFQEEPLLDEAYARFQHPQGILLRKNRFRDVEKPYCGNFLEFVEIIE